MHPKRPMIFLGEGGRNLGVSNGGVLFVQLVLNMFPPKVPNGVPNR